MNQQSVIISPFSDHFDSLRTCFSTPSPLHDKESQRQQFQSEEAAQEERDDSVDG
jgi:hypothetical protein